MLTDPHLSRVRTVLFAGMALVWFSEMLFHGLPALTELWSYLWQVAPVEDTRLAAALNVAWAAGAPSKGALFVMAVFGLLSKSPSVRTALFVSMALVPPLNVLFPFREQGFLFGPTMVGTTLSMILWGSFLLFRERARQPTQAQTTLSARAVLSRWEIWQYGWFVAYSAVLTLMALLFVLWPITALNLALPCLSSSPVADNPLTDGAALQSLTYPIMASGTHLAAVATGFWIGTANCRSNPALRHALTAAGIAHSGLFLLFPLRQIASAFGGSCATSSILIAFVPLFAGWLLYAALAYTAEAKTAPLLR